MKLKKQIIELLGTQYKSSDEPLVDELIYNFKMLQRAKDGLEEQGLMINISRGEDPYYQKNPLFSIYDTCLKNINTLYTKLNVSPLDRRNWVVNTEADDNFDQDFA
jgi:P27 family predicted phage terminase small subunit